MKKIFLMTFISLFSTLTFAFANECTLDQTSFFWDIEMTNKPLVTELSDRTEDEASPEITKILLKKGYSFSKAQRAAAPNFGADNEYDYYPNGRFLAIAGTFEGSGEIIAVIDTKTYIDSQKPKGIYSLVDSLRPFLAEMDQKLLDSSEDFVQTSGFKINGVVAVAGVKERFFFGLGQSKAMIETFSRIPTCNP